MTLFFAGLAALISGHQPDETASAFTEDTAPFALVEIDGAVFGARATIGFPEEGRAMGEAPCNRWSADQPAPYPWVDFGAIAATKRACVDLQAEGLFFSALSEMTLIEVAGATLILSNDAGREMVFRQEK